MTARARLSSLSTALDELTERVASLAEELGGAGSDGTSADLYEVERMLTTAQRRLARIVDTRPGP